MRKYGGSSRSRYRDQKLSSGQLYYDRDSGYSTGCDVKEYSTHPYGEYRQQHRLLSGVGISEDNPGLPENVYEARIFDERTKEVLQNGGRVYLSPDADEESLPYSIKTQFTTDFWSVGTFADQEGGMGQLIDTEHPILRNSPRIFTRTGNGGSWQRSGR